MAAAADTERRAPRRRDDWPAHYRARNQLILLTSGATEVAGYREWQSFGRQVRKGEHGIALLAPIVRKDKDTGDARVVSVKTTTVFDVSQTDPKEETT